MGFWKDVSMDMQRGMSRETAIRINAILRTSNNKEERDKAIREGEREIKLNTLP